MSETVVIVVSVSVAGVVCITFLIVVAICYRQWNKHQRSRVYLRERYRGIRSCSSTPTSPIAASVSTSSSSPSCGFLFPKQENTDWNNIPVKSNRVREAKNANAASICPNSVNEYLEYLEEPEVFELEPITRRKAATPLESPPMKVKRTQIVTFASSYNVSDGNGVVMQVKVPSPPPPLPPKAKSLTYAELTFESETKVVVKEEEEESEAVAPPLPPKPTVLLPEKAEKEKESVDQKKEKGENEMKVEEEDEEDDKQEEVVEVEEEKEDEKEGEEKEEEVGQKVEGVSSAAVVSAVENGAVEHQKNGTTHEEHGTETEKDEEKEVEDQDEEEAAKERESDRSEETPSSCVVYERLVSEDHSVSSAGNGADPCSGGSSPNEVSTVTLLPRSDSP